MMLDLIRKFGSEFKISFSISGPALEQLLQHAPEVIHGFQELAATGCVEFIGETYAHSLASLGSKQEFIRQVEKHRKRIEDLFGQRPTTFRNTELIYDDQIGKTVEELGFDTMFAEGAKHILGWKSPNFMYCNVLNPRLKLLLRNFRLSDDIIFKFSNREWSEWPLTTEKFVGWLNKIDANEEVVNLFMNYETLGEQQRRETGIFDFFSSFPQTLFNQSNFRFALPRELTNALQPVAPVSVTYPVSWADEEKDLTAWLGNELQDEAFGKLYGIEKEVMLHKQPDILRDWERLQTSDHFYYMCTKWFSDGEVHRYFNPYPSPYEAFINYMNVLSDFIIRVEDAGEPIPEKGADITESKDQAPKTPKKKVKPKTAKPKTVKSGTKPTKPAKSAKTKTKTKTTKPKK